MTAPIVLSFDIEEHHRIEAAAHLDVEATTKTIYAERMERTTRLLLEQLAGANNTRATFYIVGEIARTHPTLVKTIAAAGHEIASHSDVHHRVHRFNPETFAEDLKRSIDSLQQCAGEPVVGYRAPTFSVMRSTSWAVDLLINAGISYDSSIFPVRHDRYGVPDAPRVPFWLEGSGGQQLLEFPPLTLHTLGQNLPVAGGGYFRLFPLSFLHAGLKQMATRNAPGMLYFHPWEFDPDQPKLPLKRVSKFRTYVGIGKSTRRLGQLLVRYTGQFRRAVDVVGELIRNPEALPTFRLSA